MHRSRRTSGARRLLGAVPLFVLALVIGSVGPLLTQRPAEGAGPSPTRTVATAWNVGATGPEICDFSDPQNLSCTTLPIVDPAPDGTAGVIAADVNLDGLVDVVTGNENGRINVCLDDGASGWDCSAHGSSARHNGVAVADLNGDLVADLVSPVETNTQLELCLGDGVGGFTCSITTGPDGARSVRPLDADGDGDIDLAFAAQPGGPQLCLNDGSANFSCSNIDGVTQDVIDLEIADVDGDSNDDIVFVGWGGDDLVCWGDGFGFFVCTTFDHAGATSGVDVADVDGDGLLDLVTVRWAAPSRVCLNDGLTAFTCSDMSGLNANARDVALADLDGDSVPDLAVGLEAQNLWCPGDGFGDFPTCSNLGTTTFNSMGVTVLEGAPADGDGDGVPDVFDNCPASFNPAQTDTDFDLAGDACDLDDDDDGLSDVDETGIHGTDPLLVDTDFDGVDDGTEVANGSNPLLPPQPQSISIASPVSHEVQHGDFLVDASSTAGLSVSLAVSGDCVGPPPLVTPNAIGTCTIDATQAGDDDWLAATATFDVDLVASPQTISLAVPTSVEVGQSAAAFASATSGLTVTMVASGPCTVAATSITITGVGTCTVTADQAGGGLWSPAPTETANITGTAPATTTTTTTTTTTIPGTTTTTTMAPVTVTTTIPPAAPATTIPRATTTTTGPTTATTSAAPTTTATPTTTAAPTTTATTATTTTPTATTTRNTTPSPTTTQPREAVVSRRGEVVVVATTADLLIRDGFPVGIAGPTEIIVSDAGAGSVLTLMIGREKVVVEAGPDGEILVEIDDGADLAEAIFVLERADNTRMIVSSVDDLSEVAPGVDVDVRIDGDEGDPAGGTTVGVFGAGFLSGTTVEVTMHSDPVGLGTVSAGQDGGFATTMKLPIDAESGEHRIILVGETSEGTLSSSWHFAIDPVGAIERIGDPQPETESAIVAQAPLGATDDEPVLLDSPGADAAAGDADAPAVTIDERTGLPTYTPLSEPEQTVDDAVEAFALASILGASGTLALGAGALANGSRPSGGSGGGGDGDPKRKRGKGKVASAKAKKMGDIDQRAAWGDRSRTWQLPFTSSFDRSFVGTAKRVQPVSPLAARLMSDGSTVRAVFGSAWLLAPIIGILLALAALGDTAGHAIAPSFGLMAALLVLGTIDASGGFAAVATFWIGVVASGGIASADDVRSLLGITTLWFAVPLIASAVRAFRRPPGQTLEDRWKGLAEIVVGSMLAAWTVQSVVKSLPGLSGLDQPISARADQLALIALGALITRYLFERLVVIVYPERLAAATFEPDGKPGILQQTGSLVIKTSMFAFVILPYIGGGWALWLVAAMSFVPSFAGIWKKSFPNSSALYRVLPRGIPNTLMMMTIGAIVGSAVAQRFENPATLLLASFVILSIPGFVLSTAGLIGRDGVDPQGSWQLRLAGVWVSGVAVTKILGYLGDSVVVPLVLVSPLAIWWLVVSTAATRAAAAKEEEEEEEESDDAVNDTFAAALPIVSPTAPTPDERWSVAALADEILWPDEAVGSDDSDVGSGVHTEEREADPTSRSANAAG